MSATRGAKQLHSLIARSCQKHMYLQTSRHPAKLQPRMVAKHSLAGWPRRWFPGQYWSPDWHHLSYRGQEPSRATMGRQVHSEGRPTGQAGRAIPILSGCLAPSPSGSEAGGRAGSKGTFGPPWRLFLLPSVKSSFLCRAKRTRERSGLKMSPTSPHQAPLTPGTLLFHCLFYDGANNSPSLSFHYCKMG